MHHGSRIPAAPLFQIGATALCVAGTLRLRTKRKREQRSRNGGQEMTSFPAPPARSFAELCTLGHSFSTIKYFAHFAKIADLLRPSHVHCAPKASLSTSIYSGCFVAFPNREKFPEGLGSSSASQRRKIYYLQECSFMFSTFWRSYHGPLRACCQATTARAGGDNAFHS